jgi:quinol monooxygenase YgiN
MEGVCNVSVIITAKFQGDTAKFRQSLAERAGEFEKYGQQSRAAGALHHRFAVGDGFVLVIDEWESLGQFEQFFTDPDLQAFIGEIGAAPGPPEMIIAEAVSSPDEF